MSLNLGADADQSPQGDARGRAALAAWVERGLSTPLERWLDGVLDEEGVPRRLPAGDWGRLLARLDEVRRSRTEGWPDRLDARIEGLFRATLRFARADGTAVFTPAGAPLRPDVPASFRAWAERLSDPGLATVVDWWFPRPRRARPTYASPPLPAWSSPDVPLAILRANWSHLGDFLAIDHRRRGAASSVELAGMGRTWLGPTWVAESALEPGSVPAMSARPGLWVSNPAADLVEWTFRHGATRVTRTALLLRGRRIALLADEVSGPGGRAGFQVSLPAGVEAAPLAEGRGWGWGLTGRGGRPSARVVPFGLPRVAGPSHGGTLTTEAGSLCLRQSYEGRRCWLPLLVSWDPHRNRKAISWRVLSVAEQSRRCPAETAFAARVSWGRGETLLIYRSLARPALRSFLGHQTRARFLVALFTQEGNLVPIVKVD